MMKTNAIKKKRGNTKNVEPKSPKKNPLIALPIFPHTPYVPRTSIRFIAKNMIVYISRRFSGGVAASALS